MNRRGLVKSALAALASIPGLAWIEPGWPEPGNLAQLRDMLLPGLRGINGRNPDVELSIRIDHTTGSLLVIGNRNWIELAFAITDAQIRDRRYIAEFTPNVKFLIECLRSDKAKVLAAAGLIGKSA